MTIKSLSHAQAIIFLSANKHKWHVICITNSDKLVPKDIQSYSKSYLNLVFDDIDCQLGNYILPSKVDVEKALDYCKGKDNIIVTCFSGTTRSPALVYAINCKRDYPTIAINSITQSCHPNRLIIRYASEILQDAEVFDVYEDWAKPDKFVV